jgi:hypothetical protein
MGYSPPPQDRMYMSQPLPPDVQGASTTALWLEIVFGFFGLLGVGHAYTGRLLLGALLMIGWWVFVGLGAFITSLTFGIAACLFGPLYIAAPIISGIQARTYVQREYSTGSWPSVIGLAGGGCLLMVVITVILVFVVGIGIFGLETLSQF